MATVRLKAGEIFISADVLDESTVVSKFTGKDLMNLEVTFRAHEKEKEVLEQAISNQTGKLLSQDDDPSKELPVRLFQKTYSYRDGNPVQTYVWNITQTEKVNLESLEIGEEVLRPYVYREELDGDALIITARVEINSATNERLTKLENYFPVVRKGIQDEPRLMRFGTNIWSEQGEKRKVQLTLVEEIYDKEKHGRSLLQPEFGNVSALLARTHLRMKSLMNTLKSKGILTGEEIAQILDVSDTDRREQIGQFYRVEDLDAWIEREE